MVCTDSGTFTETVTPATAGTFVFRARYITNGEWNDYANATSTTTTLRAR